MGEKEYPTENRYKEKAPGRALFFVRQAERPATNHRFLEERLRYNKYGINVFFR